VNRCYIALGSNQQQPEAQLRQAVSAISQLADSQLGPLSHCYRSAAIGPGEQPDYLNAVLQLDTRLTPEALLDALQAIENRQGRTRTVRWGPRTLDLDILLYGTLALSTDRLQIPHPRMAQRNFVLYPLLDVAGANLMLPDGLELGTLVSACPRGELVQSDLDLATGEN
jgi:2-amino-4-hydroxy-6-hydroxymethyldihydropteridine diphosphokinase